MESIEKNQISRDNKSMISSEDEANITRLMQSRMSDAEDKHPWKRELNKKSIDQKAVYYDSAGSTNYASGWENWTKKTKMESSAENWTRKSGLAATRPESSAEGWNKASGDVTRMTSLDMTPTAIKRASNLR